MSQWEILASVIISARPPVSRFNNRGSCLPPIERLLPRHRFTLRAESSRGQCPFNHTRQFDFRAISSSLHCRLLFLKMRQAKKVIE